MVRPRLRNLALAVSVYAVNKLCRRVVQEPELRRSLAEQPEATLRALAPPLSEEEIAMLLAGDVGALAKHGTNHFLLHQLARWGLLGLDLPTHGARIRAAFPEQVLRSP
jgi:hypothetical protein